MSSSEALLPVIAAGDSLVTVKTAIPGGADDVVSIGEYAAKPRDASDSDDPKRAASGGSSDSDDPEGAASWDVDLLRYPAIHVSGRSKDLNCHDEFGDPGTPQ